MHNTDDVNNNWDDLVSEFGLEPDSTKPKTPDDQQIHVTLPAPTEFNGVADEDDAADDVEVEDIADVAPAPTGAMFDPGPDQVLDDGEGQANDDDEFDDTDSPDLFDTEATPAADATQEGGKRKRKRRRRKKKKGGDPNAPPETVGQQANVTEEIVPDDEAVAAVVEEGDAPAEITDDDDEAPPTSAVDEELVASANLPKQEWNVMTWSELIGKLHRPS